jgi:hypothetical protein
MLNRALLLTTVDGRGLRIANLLGELPALAAWVGNAFGWVKVVECALGSRLLAVVW